MTDTLAPPTKLWTLMEERGIKRAWLGRKLRVNRQTTAAWIRGDERCPTARQAQIALHLSIRAAEYFDTDGYAIREET